MELTQLIQFKTVAEYENISKAAKELFIGQPALSMSIKKLEEELGCSLFDRTKNKIRLNADGQIVLTTVNRVLSDLEAMKAQLSSSGTSRQTLRIASSFSASLRYMIPAFQSAYPDIAVSSSLLHQEKLIANLIERQSDLIISATPSDHPMLGTIPFCQERLYVSIPHSHPLSKQKSISLTELRGENILRLKEDTSYLSNLLENYRKSRNIHLNYIYHNDYVVYQEMMKNENYIYFVSSIIIKNSVTPNRRLVPLNDKELFCTCYILYRNDNQAAVAPFIRWIHEHYKEIMV